MPKVYTYEPDKQIMQSTESMPEITIVVRINLKKTTIAYANSEPWRKIDDGDFYVFLDFMKHIRSTPDLMDALLTNPYYTKHYLNTSLGVFNTPIDDDYLRKFSSFILPYEALYSELETKPDYAYKILAKYDENNSLYIREFKEFVRIILIVPGLVFTPLILISIYPALNGLT